MNLVFVVMWVVSIAFSALIGAAAITYIRRTWQLIRSDSDLSTTDRLLDGVDHLENQMHLVAERLGSLEERLAGMEKRLGEGRSSTLPRQEDASPLEAAPPETGTSSAEGTSPMEGSVLGDTGR